MSKKAVKNAMTKKTKTKVYNVFINALAIIAVGGTMLWIGVWIYHDAKENIVIEREYQKTLPNLGDSIAHMRVCMASNIYLGSKQIAVPSGGKIYFACSEQCVHQLGIDSIRYTIDPVSEQKVDKAMSIITLNPDKTGAVIYFESIDTYSRYLKALDNTAKEK
jgi:YHS domain-containing protein